MRRNERGAATVELALSIPLLVMLLVLMAQVAGVLMVQLGVQEAARAGARAASVDSQPGAAAAAAKAATGLNPTKVQVTTSTGDPRGMVSVQVRFPVTIRMPFTNTALVTQTLESTVAMPLETAG